MFHFLTRKELKEFLRDNEISIRIDNCAANLHPKIFPKGRRNRFVPWANFASGNLARGWPRVGSNCYRVLHYKDSCVYVLPWTPRTTTNGEHVKHTKMPTQSKKSVSITTSERPAKPKKKKKKESGRNSRNSFSKTPTSGVDSSSEGLFSSNSVVCLLLWWKETFGWVFSFERVHTFQMLNLEILFKKRKQRCDET